MSADTLVEVPRYVEGPALFFFTRWKSVSRAVFHVPTLVDGNIAETRLDFRRKKERVEISAWADPIRTRKYEGFAAWKGATSAGLSGEFTGWISDDDAAVPLRAEMKVLLGSIIIELERWQRKGWVPPMYVEAVKN